MFEEYYIYQEVLDALAFKRGRSLLLDKRYYIDDWEDDEDIKAIYEKSDEDLFKFIDQIDCFKTLPAEKLLGLKRFVANCGRIIAIGDGALRLYLNEEKEGVDVELVSFFLTALGEEMEYIRYVTTEASEIFIDHIDDNDKNGVVFTATYKL